MKKTLALMMAAVLLLSLLCACGGEDKAKGPEGEWKDPALPDYVMIVGDGQARVEDAGETRFPPVRIRYKRTRSPS